MIARPASLQGQFQTPAPLINLCHFWMLPGPIILPGLKWGLKMRKARYHPLAQCTLMKLVEMMSLRKEMVRNSDEHHWNADRNGVPGDGKEVGLQPVDVVSWFTTIGLTYDSEDPYILELVILLTEFLIKQLYCHPKS